MNVALRRTLTAAFILHSFLAFARPASAQDAATEQDPAAQDTAPIEATAYGEPAPESAPLPPPEEAEAPSTRPERVKVHDVGLGYHAVMFRTESSDRYALHGPSVVYNYYVGRRWGFVLRGAAYFPLTGRMNGPNGDFRGSLRELYATRHYGFDGIFGVGRRMVINDKLTITASVGVHFQSFTVGGASVSPVEAITMGVAGTGRLEYALTRILHLGVEFEAGLDPIDLIKHDNRAVLTIPLSGAVSLGVDF
jgi:hypothetical protein